MGKVFMLCAPSGAGKTSIARKIIKRDGRLIISISHTTREPRLGEIDGKDYNFVSRECFEDLSKKNQFIEKAEVYGNLYGTSRDWVMNNLKEDKDILLEIDSIGAAQIRANIERTVSIFILPPSLKALEARLINRRQDTPEVIKTRLKLMHKELAHINEFDYVIINKDLDHAVDEFASILRAERLRFESQSYEIKKCLDEDL